MEVKDYIMTGIIPLLGAILSLYFSLKAKRHSDIVLLNGYIDQATKEFEKKGSPKDYIESLLLDIAKKEIIWRQSHIRYKGKYPDRQFSDIPKATSAMGFSIGEYEPIMEALANGQFEDKTARQLSEETKRDVHFVSKALNWFWDNELVQKRSADNGTYWSLTERGWNLHRNIEATKLSRKECEETHGDSP